MAVRHRSISRSIKRGNADILVSESGDRIVIVRRVDKSSKKGKSSAQHRSGFHLRGKRYVRYSL